MQCPQCESLLIDYESGELNPLESEAVSQHLKQCDQCSAQLSDLIELRLMTNSWQDHKVPHWNPSYYFFKEKFPFSIASMVAMAASTILVVLLINQFDLSWDGNTTPKLSQEDYINSMQLNDRLEELKERQTNNLNESISRLRFQQLESAQLLLQTAMEINRQERHQDLDNIFLAWRHIQARQTETTDQGLKYLLYKQEKDDRVLQQLDAALRQVNNKF